eukprot:jgi/Undpi1/6165/HiC_scaffold_20.g08649.m1
MRRRILAEIYFRSCSSYKLPAATTLAVEELKLRCRSISIALQLFRQMRAEYFRLSEKGVPDADMLAKLRESYQTMVNRTDPLHKYRGNKAPQKWDCPKVRFGRTGLMMPIITCGGMRQQFTWKQQASVSNSDITKECDENFQAIVDKALELGINHFETAQGYGTSEIQFGHALKKHDRSRFILQSKANAKEDPRLFREGLELSFKKLQVDYLDIFSVHGINTFQQLDWVLREGGCMEVLEEYRAAGKIRWIGFSTHAHAPVIKATISSNKFDSMNIHYHFCGSYTASGTNQELGGCDGNMDNVKLAHSLDMGVFCISPNDKGGELYKPSKVLADACAESGITPIEFHSLWQWTKQPVAHTFSVGVARPSDFDEHVAAAKMFHRAGDLVPPVEKALRARMVDRLGEEWMATWWHGLPGAYDTPTGVFVPHIVWLWNVVTAWGMYEFARNRYATLEANMKVRKAELSDQENIAAWNKFTPGYPYRPDVDIEPHIPDSCPNKTKVLKVLKEAHEWLCKENEAEVRKNLESRGWLSAFDLQPDVPFPERK